MTKNQITVIVFERFQICKLISYQEVSNKSTPHQILSWWGGNQNNGSKLLIGRPILLEKFFSNWPARIDFQKNRKNSINLPKQSVH